MKDLLPPALATGLEKALSADDCPDWLRLVISMLLTFMDSLYQQARANTELLSQLVTENAELRAENGKLRKAPFKPKSERHASSSGEGKSKLAGAEKESGEPKEPRTGPPALDGAPLNEQIITHPVPSEALHCPLCGGHSFVAMPPEDAIEYELIVEHLTRLIHRRQKMACTCGGHIVTAPCPERVTEGGSIRALSARVGDHASVYGRDSHQPHGGHPASKRHSDGYVYAQRLVPRGYRNASRAAHRAEEQGSVGASRPRRRDATPSARTRKM